MAFKHVQIQLENLVFPKEMELKKNWSLLKEKLLWVKESGEMGQHFGSSD